MGKGVNRSSMTATRVGKGPSMSRAHMPMTQGKMSGAHGVTNGGGKHKTLRNADNAVGKSGRDFGKGILGTPPKMLKGSSGNKGD